MSRQRIPNIIILAIAGVALLLLGTFPQTLWASHGDRLLIKGTFGDLSLVFANQLHGRHHPPQERPRYRGTDRHGRPVGITTTITTTSYRDHRRHSSHRGYSNPGYHRPPRGHRHSRPNHYYRNRHRHPRAEHYYRSRWNR